MKSLQLGDTVEDMQLLKADGSTTRLSDYQGALLLIFLRHLRCISCLGHVRDIEERSEQIEAAGVQVLVITQSKPTSLQNTPIKFTILCDPERKAYRYFGLDRGRLSMFFRPWVLFRYFKMIFRGIRIRWSEPDEDVLQLGGDFLVSANRRLVFAHRSNDPADRPTLRSLLSEIVSFNTKK